MGSSLVFCGVRLPRGTDTDVFFVQYVDVIPPITINDAQYVCARLLLKTMTTKCFRSGRLPRNAAWQCKRGMKWNHLVQDSRLFTLSAPTILCTTSLQSSHGPKHRVYSVKNMMGPWLLWSERVHIIVRALLVSIYRDPTCNAGLYVKRFHGISKFYDRLKL